VSETTFPEDFLWGTATASYQIEGAAHEDGRGESIWDRFCATPGKVRNGDNGDVACDFYHRYREDIALLRELGTNAFRFSVAWPRVLPDGDGTANARGLDFYDRLVDALLDAGIEPVVTLYHWDLPQALEDRGGWPARNIVDAFGAYVTAVADRLGDRVRHWVTHNEPRVVAWHGYGWGEHAPGRTSERDALAAAHHVLLSHGRAVAILRSLSPGTRVGITLDLHHVYTVSDEPEDLAAARHQDGFHNRWFLDPIFRGTYPDDMLEYFAASAPHIEEGDLAAISAPLDFLGVNNYSRRLVRADPDGGDPLDVHAPDSDYTDMGWEVYPDGLHDLLLRLRDDYDTPGVYITENGAAFADVRGHDGRVHDLERRDYFERHIGAVGRAVEAGVPVKGYFAWTLMDNFEWALGYWKRFGLVYMDFPTLARVPKESFYWYRDFIAEQRRPRRLAAEPAQP
jgi:beta-glucosidase